MTDDRRRRTPTVMTIPHISLISTVCMAFCAIAPGQSVRADEGILVVGTASVTLVPGRAVVALELRVSADTAGEALAGFRAARSKLDKALEAIEGGALKTGVSTPKLGIEIDVQQVMMGRGGPVADPKIEASEIVEVRISASADKSLLDLVTETIDGGLKIGAKLAGPDPMVQMGFYGGATGGPAAVRYVVDDIAAAQEKALTAALEDARAQAVAVAKISGVRLGSVAGIDLSGATLQREFEVPNPPAQRLQVRVRFGIPR